VGDFSALAHLECPRCGAAHGADAVIGLCTCGSPLLARYDLDLVARTLAPPVIATRPPSLWRYHEVLPVRDRANVVTLGEGMTPLTALPGLGRAVDVPGLLIKDEGLVPTGTFKARGATVGVARARELGAKAIAMPTNGNAGATWAAYAARAGMSSTIVMPEQAPAVNRAECSAAGADLYLVRGHIGDAGRVVADFLARHPDVFDASTLKEPYRIEGKKTMGYEIVEQLGWVMPDVVVYPTGGGVGLIAHSGDYGHLFRLKADTVPVESGQVRGQAVPVVAVRLSSGPATGPGHLTGYSGSSSAAGPPSLTSWRDRPPLRWSGAASLTPCLRRRQAAWRHAGSQKRLLEPAAG